MNVILEQGIGATEQKYLDLNIGMIGFIFGLFINNSSRSDYAVTNDMMISE
jgi:hypothetical protein